MKRTEAQNRATAKWSAKPESKVKLYNNVLRCRENNPEKYLESQRLSAKKYYAKKRGYECYDDYIYDVTIRCIYKLYD
tara:strand:+ start:76 stop:309 length:234 start_codon:yes stop_codon:yes gene_type:complete